MYGKGWPFGPSAFYRHPFRNGGKCKGPFFLRPPLHGAEKKGCFPTADKVWREVDGTGTTGLGSLLDTAPRATLVGPPGQGHCPGREKERGSPGIGRIRPAGPRLEPATAETRRRGAEQCAEPIEAEYRGDPTPGARN